MRKDIEEDGLKNRFIEPNNRIKRSKHRIDENFAWMVYNFIIDWKNCKYGVIPLQEALDEYFYSEEAKK